MVESFVQKKANSTGLGSLIRRGSESLNNMTLAVAVLGISLASSLSGQFNPIVAQEFGVTQFGHGTSIGFNIPLHYNAMPQTGSYVLSRATDEHCYVAGINFDSGKPKLFIRVFDPYPKDYKNTRFTCGYAPYTLSTESIATASWGTDKSVKDSKEISITQGENVTASMKIVDGSVKIYVRKGKEKDGIPAELSAEIKDNSIAFDMPVFYFPPSRSIGGIPRRTNTLGEKPIVTDETAIWSFR